MSPLAVDIVVWRRAELELLAVGCLMYMRPVVEGVRSSLRGRLSIMRHGALSSEIKRVRRFVADNNDVSASIIVDSESPAECRAAERDIALV